MPPTKKQLNPKDVKFADTYAPRIASEWKTKFITGAHEHGGTGKPAIFERAGLYKDQKQEAYDLISYIEAREVRINNAKMTLQGIIDYKGEIVNLNFLLKEVINLLS